MVLPTIDLSAMERAAQDRAERKLSEYLCHTMKPVLPRLPSAPEYVWRFVPVAAKHAAVAGYPDGRPFSLHVMISFLLGSNWPDDPFHADVQRILTAPGMSLDSRLDMAMSTAIQHRQRLESKQPQMHAITLGLLTNPGIDGDPDDVWRGFRELAQLRGVALHDFDSLWNLYTAYEADACRLLGYTGVRRAEKLCAYERMGCQHMNQRVPLPTDDYRTLDPRICQALIHHVLMALTFGRGFRTNPLLQGLHDVLGDTTRGTTRNTALLTFLEQHRRVLMETSHGQ